MLSGDKRQGLKIHKIKHFLLLFFFFGYEYCCLVHSRGVKDKKYLIKSKLEEVILQQINLNNSYYTPADEIKYFL